VRRYSCGPPPEVLTSTGPLQLEIFMLPPEFLEAFKSLTISQIMVIMEQDNIKPVESEDLELFKKYFLGELQRILEADESEEGISEAEEHLLDRFDFYYHRSIREGWVPD